MNDKKKQSCKVTFYYETGRIENLSVYGTEAQLAKDYQDVWRKSFFRKPISAINGTNNTLVINLNQLINITVEQNNV